MNAQIRNNGTAEIVSCNSNWINSVERMSRGQVRLKTNTSGKACIWAHTDDPLTLATIVSDDNIIHVSTTDADNKYIDVDFTIQVDDPFYKKYFDSPLWRVLNGN